MEGNSELADLEPISAGMGESGFSYEPVQMQNFFIGAFGDSMFVGGTSVNRPL